jgi:hypothetical protein
VFPFLDENERSVDAVETAAFIEGLSKIQAALGKDDIDGVISQLELDPSAKNSVEAFLAALVDKVKEKNEDAMDED